MLIHRAMAAAIVLSAVAPIAHAAPNACDEIRQACRKAGFHDGGHPSVEACYGALVYGAAPPKGLPLPAVGSRLTRECRASLEKKPTAAASPAEPGNTAEPSSPSSRLPTAVSPHNPPPTNPGPGPEAPSR